MLNTMLGQNEGRYRGRGGGGRGDTCDKGLSSRSAEGKKFLRVEPESKSGA